MRTIIKGQSDKPFYILLYDIIDFRKWEEAETLMREWPRIYFNRNSNYGFKTLMKAVKCGQLELVKYLVENGANIHLYANNDYILSYATTSRHLNVVKWSVENGVDIHACYDEALRNAAKREQLEIMKYLVENGADIHACHDKALRYSAKWGYLEVVKYLVEKGANIHADNDEALNYFIYI